MRKLFNCLHHFLQCEPEVEQKEEKPVVLDKETFLEKKRKEFDDIVEYKFRLNNLFDNTPLTYKGVSPEHFPIEEIVKNPVIGDSYNRGLTLEIWTGEEWLSKDYGSWEDVIWRFAHIELDEIANAYKEHLYSISNSFEFGKSIQIGEYSISEGYADIDKNYDASINLALKYVYGEVEQYRKQNHCLFAANIRQTSNQKVLEMADTVCDCSVDDDYVAIIRAELINRTKVMQDLETAKAYL